MSKISDVFAAEIAQVRKSWVWFLLIGILLMVLGATCIVKAQTATTFWLCAGIWQRGRLTGFSAIGVSR